MINGFISPVNNILILELLKALIASLTYFELNEILRGSPL